jgi:hypothetical protein
MLRLGDRKIHLFSRLAVGSTVAAAAIMVAIVLLAKRHQRAGDVAENKRIQEKELQEIGR